jgi:energy-coupling factor transporter ATP-binding protein EcfA2
MYPNINALRRDVGRRLRRGEHMVLYGPFGSGKSTLLADLATRLRGAGVPCAHATSTHSLDDITRALEKIPAAVDAQGSTRSRALPQSRTIAEFQNAVLLLDHLTDVSNAMVGFLRRFRAGVLTAVDIDIELEQRHLKPWRLGALSIRMPPVSAALLHELLQVQCTDQHVPLPSPDDEVRLVGAAFGRPGWILKCVDLQAQGRYRQGEQLLVSELSCDTENALRQLAHGRKL